MKQQYYKVLSSLSLTLSLSLIHMRAHAHTHAHTHDGILLGHRKELNFAILNNMRGPGGYYAKWNKSDRGRQIL